MHKLFLKNINKKGIYLGRIYENRILHKSTFKNISKSYFVAFVKQNNWPVFETYMKYFIWVSLSLNKFKLKLYFVDMDINW